MSGIEFFVEDIFEFLAEIRVYGCLDIWFRDYEEKSVNKIFYDNDRRKTGMKSAFRLCFIYNSYKIACQERAGNPPVFLTFFIIPVSVPHT